MDAVLSYRLPQAMPESCTGSAYLRLLGLEIMCVVVDSYRSIKHRGHGATPSCGRRLLSSISFALSELIGTRVPQVQRLLFIKVSKMGHTCGSHQPVGGV